ncbi:MAG: YwaF family protein [Clostridia bacterium]|nr:YwaF family protein [Clostridia bacterium]
MNWFEKILAALDGRMEVPTWFGWYHLLCLGIVIGLVVLVCFTCRKLTEKQFRIICLVVSLVLILLEVYKQLNFSYDVASDTWSYHWYAFPFQFCSSPMYVLLLIACLKECKFREYLCSFLATFGLLAGVLVMCYPVSCYIDVIGINIQTMVHHGAMVVMGGVLLASGKAKIEHKTILKAMSVFAVLVGTAFLMNIIFHSTGNTQTFNMFYIGPYFDCELPILYDIGVAMNIAGPSITFMNILFLLIYIVSFSVCAYIVLLIFIFAKWVKNKHNQKHPQPQQV